MKQESVMHDHASAHVPQRLRRATRCIFPGVKAGWDRVVAYWPHLQRATTQWLLDGQRERQRCFRLASQHGVYPLHVEMCPTRRPVATEIHALIRENMEARQCAVLTIRNRLPQQSLQLFSDTLAQPIEMCP